MNWSAYLYMTGNSVSKPFFLHVSCSQLLPRWARWAFSPLHWHGGAMNYSTTVVRLFFKRLPRWRHFLPQRQNNRIYFSVRQSIPYTQIRHHKEDWFIHSLFEPDSRSLLFEQWDAKVCKMGVSIVHRYKFVDFLSYLLLITVVTGYHQLLPPPSKSFSKRTTTRLFQSSTPPATKQ